MYTFFIDCEYGMEGLHQSRMLGTFDKNYCVCDCRDNISFY